MTAALVGVFLLHHFDAEWGWYAALIGYALLEIYHQDKFRKAVIRRLANIQIALFNAGIKADQDNDD